MKVFSTLLIVVLIVGCAAFSPYEANNFPEYPFSFRIYYDGRCDLQVNNVSREPVVAEGVLDFHDRNMRTKTEYSDRYYRTVIYNCKYTDSYEQIALLRHLQITIYFDYSLDGIDELLTKDVLTSNYGSAPAFQFKLDPLELELSRTEHDYTKAPFLKHNDLTSDYVVRVLGHHIGSMVPRPAKADRSCSGDIAADFHGKNGNLIIYPANEHQSDGVYLSMEGNLVVAGSDCF